MPSPRSARVWVDLSPFQSAANDTVTVCKPVPEAGTIAVVRVVQNLLGAAASGTWTIGKGAVNILSAASVDSQADLVAGTAEDLVLTTAGSSLRVTTTDYLKAVYTLTTCALTSAIGVYVGIDPDVW
jgi:hypothetical protein